MKLENTMLDEISQIQEGKFHVFSCMKNQTEKQNKEGMTRN